MRVYGFQPARTLQEISFELHINPQSQDGEI
jgi:hypothetical protein